MYDGIKFWRTSLEMSKKANFDPIHNNQTYTKAHKVPIILQWIEKAMMMEEDSNKRSRNF